MAIARKGSAENELTLLFNNGDVEVLQDAVKRLGFKDEESLLRYALAVLSKSATRTLTVIGKDGKNLTLNPGDTLLADKPGPPPVAKPVEGAAK
jgi:hypothetical protein